MRSLTVSPTRANSPPHDLTSPLSLFSGSRTKLSFYNSVSHHYNSFHPKEYTDEKNWWQYIGASDLFRDFISTCFLSTTKNSISGTPLSSAAPDVPSSASNGGRSQPVQSERSQTIPRPASHLARPLPCCSPPSARGLAAPLCSGPMAPLHLPGESPCRRCSSLPDPPRLPPLRRRAGARRQMRVAWRERIWRPHLLPPLSM